MKEYQITIKKIIVDEFENEDEIKDFVENWATNENVDLELFDVETKCLTKTIELDTVDPVHPKFVTWLKEHHIEKTVIDPDGPGGWPVVKYSGSKENLKAMIVKWWESDDWFYQFIY